MKLITSTQWIFTCILQQVYVSCELQSLHGECDLLRMRHMGDRRGQRLQILRVQKDEPYIHQGTSNNWKGEYQQRLTILL